MKTDHPLAIWWNLMTLYYPRWQSWKLVYTKLKLFPIIFGLDKKKCGPKGFE
jgi:hypothetical protein